MSDKTVQKTCGVALTSKLQPHFQKLIIADLMRHYSSRHREGKKMQMSR